MLESIEQSTQVNETNTREAKKQSLRWLKVLSKLVFAMVFLAGIWTIWDQKFASTKIAIVNFRDFQYNEMIEANTNPWVRLYKLDSESIENMSLNRFDAMFVFGRGLNFSDNQAAIIRKAASRGMMVYVSGATNPAMDLTNLNSEWMEKVSAYFENGGRRNLKSLFEFTRREIDGKSYYSNNPEPPVIIPSDAFFHVGENSFFPDLATYEEFRVKQGLANEKGQRVALVTSIFGPRSANRAYVDELINRLESGGINVYPVAGFLKRFENLKAIRPDLVIYIPHGRLAPGKADDCITWLQENGIPLICPIDVFENYDQWVASQKGMQGGMMSQNILMPELDGGVEPFAISAQFPNDRGLNVPKALPERMDKLVSRVKHWLNLKSKPNSEKKLAIVYFKGPGQNAMVASGMEVGASLLNMLNALKKAGYYTGSLPATAKEMESLINQKGPVLGPYAKGEIAKFIKTGNPALIPSDKLETWAKKQLDPKMYESVVKQYGPPPGDYLTTDYSGNKSIALPRLQFGNVTVLPQLLPAIGEDTERLVHGVKQAPPYSYIASYLWARHEFNADALIHFGTHGSLEFTPWKQNALSDLDWPDALVGDLPHLYVYVINNIGEAVIAKRRSYATIVSHLTPPMTESGLYGPLKALQDTIGRYDNTTDELLQVELEKSIRNLVIELNLHKDLKLAVDGSRPLTEDQIEEVHDYLHSVADEKITRGLYVLGRAYSAEEAAETARLMSQDAVAVGQAQKRINAGTENDKVIDDPSTFETKYRQPAREAISTILAGKAKPEAFIDPRDTALIQAWDRDHPSISDDALFARFLQMGDKPGPGSSNQQSGQPTSANGGYLATAVKGNPESKSTGHPGNLAKGVSNTVQPSVDLQETDLEKLFLKVADDPANMDFLETLRADASFERVRQALDPDAMRKARRIAAFVPAMREALERMEKPGMTPLLTAMTKTQNRQKVLLWLSDPVMQKQIREKSEARNAKLIAQLQSQEIRADLAEITNTRNLTELLRQSHDEKLTKLESSLTFALSNAGLAERLPDSENASTVRKILSQSSESLVKASAAIVREKSRREEDQRQVINQLRALSQAYSSVDLYRKRIESSTSTEISSLLGALNGKYVAPSSGGDAVTNPEAVPTGRNLFPIDAEKTPSPEAWTLGKKLAEKMIEAKRAETGKEPVKVAVTLWPGEFINSQGVDIAMIFHFLGVEPVRDARGVVHDIRIVPIERLGRPRIDVVVQTAGQFRDIAATRMSLIDRAVRLAGQAADSEEFANHVREGSVAAESRLKELGLSPADARKYSTARIFGGVNGNYGTGIMGLVEAGDRWESRKEIADTYQNNMGAIYTEDQWGEFVPGLFEAAVLNTDTLVHSRTSNVTGPLKLDHVYEFMGGFSNVIASVTGKDPASYFIDMRNKHQSKVQNAEEAIWQEARSTLLNPKYIEELMQEGGSSAEVFAESVRNTYGWNAMRPDAIDDELWDELHAVYINDKYKMGLENYFREQNPFALQEVTAVMMESARKGMWEASAEQMASLAGLHASLIQEFKPGCSGFVCDNAKLRAFIGQRLTDSDRSAYEKSISSVRESGEKSPDQVKGLTLEKQQNPAENKNNTAQSEKTPALRPNSKNQEKLNNQMPVGWLLAILAGLSGVSILILVRSRTS